MFNILGRLAAYHPWKIVVGWLLIAVAAAVWAPHWDSRAHDDDVRFLPDRCRSVRAHALMEKAFPKEVDASQVIFVLERPGEKLRPADFALVGGLVADLEALRQAEPDRKIGKIVSCKDPLIGQRLTSDDGRCTLIRVALETPYMALQTQATVDRADEVLKQRLAAAGPDAPELITTGYAGIGRDLIRASGDSLDKTTLATVLLIVVILLAVYRAPLLALVPLVTIALSVFVALRLLAVMTLIPGVHLVNISQIFAVVILYGAGTDYCLFLVSRYKEELEGGYVGAVALKRTIRAVGGALAASAGTVICGLSMMGFAEFAKVRCAGPAIAVALAVALAASLTLAPALLRILGKLVFWPRRSHLIAYRFPGRVTRLARDLSLWDRISRKVVARPGLTWAVSAALLAPLAWVGANITPAYKPTAELSPKSASIRGIDAIQRHFTVGETGPLTVLLVATADWNTPEGRQLIDQLSRGLTRVDNVAEVRSLTQPLGRPTTAAEPSPSKGNLLGGLLQRVGRNLGDALAQASQAARDHYLGSFEEVEGNRYVARFDVILKTEPFAAASQSALDDIDGWLRAQLTRSAVPMGWVDTEYAGVTVHSRDLGEVTASDQKRVNLLVLVGIFLILLVVISRVWMAAYLLLTVLFSYYATLGATTLFATWWMGQPPGQLDWRVPFFLFTILAAVGEDYNILLVTRILKERRRHGTEEGTRLGLSRTGGTITACGLIMAGTFATLMLCGLNTLVQIGFALAFGVLIDTFIVRPFLVPAFLLMIWRRAPKSEAGTGTEVGELRRSA